MGKETGKTSYIERFKNTHGDNECRLGRAKHCHFLARWKTTLVRLGILSIVTTHRYGLLLLLPQNLDFSPYFTKYHYQMYLFDKTFGKMTIKRWGLSLKDITECSTREISAVELGKIADSDRNRSYYLDWWMFGGDRIFLISHSLTEQHKMADLIPS